MRPRRFLIALSAVGALAVFGGTWLGSQRESPSESSRFSEPPPAAKLVARTPLQRIVAVAGPQVLPGGIDRARERVDLVVRTFHGPFRIWTAPSAASRAQCWWVTVRSMIRGRGCIGNRVRGLGIRGIALVRLGPPQERTDVFWGRMGSNVSSIQLRLGDGERLQARSSPPFFVLAVEQSAYRRHGPPLGLFAYGVTGRIVGSLKF